MKKGTLKVPPCFSGGRSAARGRRIPSFLLLFPIVCVPYVLLSFVSLLSAAGGAPPQLRSGNLGFRSEVSGGESRRVRTACVSPMVQSFSFVEFRRFWGCLVCALGLLVSAHPWVIGCPSGNGAWELVRSHSRSGGVALGFLLPHLIKMGAWRWRSSVVGSPSSRVLGFGLAVELFRCFGPVPLFYMNLGFNGCIRSRVGELEAAIVSTLLRTTLVAFKFSGSCRSRVFQGLRVPFSPVARGNWKLSLLSARLLALRAKVKVSSKVSFFLASFCYFVA
ncbi:hypothetical protein F2Q70_00010537 [Brassica cretica]|uniref:Transmembrane protein n=1 Tax=Brassica cretica TaxID=69181 RepID=A0A8S9MCW8_BRACR|nr:hypothetical protein F2Q70_00010537 [Brassica cretica]